jgi:predicted MPP superfamily phosphohydrolase
MFKKALETNILRHDILLENIDRSSFRLFFISDIHRRKISKKLLKEVGSTIDIVIIGGDLAEANVSKKRIEYNLRKLAQLGPLYYVWGNNDREVGESTVRELIEKVNGTLVENEAVCVRDNNHRIMIVGIDDVSSGRADIQKSFESTSTKDTIIFVSHTPSVFDRVRIEHNPDILLAGHTHGGQIRLGPYGLYPLGELKIKDKKATLISNGYGTSLLPLRLGAPSECHIVTIYNSR